MKKICKAFILVVIASGVMLYTFAVFVSAENSEVNNLYTENINKVIDELDEDTVNILNSLGITDYSPEGINKISLKNTMDMLLHAFSGAYKEPLAFLCMLLGLIIINAFAGCYVSENGHMRQYFDTVSVLFSALLILSKVIQCIRDAVTSIYSLSTLMKMLIPIMGIMTAVSGSPTTAISYNALALYAAEIISAICNDMLTPILCIFAALSVCCSVNHSVKISSLLEMIKKAVNVILGFAGTIFTGIIGIKDMLSSGIDSVTVKGARFILGSAVPVVGGALSEGLNSVIAATSLMRNSYGIFMIIIISIVSVPTIMELLLWLAVLSVVAYAASALGQDGTASVLTSIKFVLSILNSIILFIVYIFIVSTALVILLHK